MTGVGAGSCHTPRVSWLAMDKDETVRALASRQHSLVARRQAHAAGISGDALRHRVQRGEWVEMGPRVLRSAATTITPLLSAQAGLLDVGGGAALARSSAAALWQLPGFELCPIHVVRSRNPGVRASGLAIVHTSTMFDERHVTELDGIRVTTPARTIFDLAGVVHPKRTELLLDRAWARGLLSWRTLHRTLHQLGSRGRPGTAWLRELADARPIDFRPPESNLEARVNDLLVADGQRPLERQVDLGDDDDWIGRTDLLDREHRLVVEIQSDLHHTSPTDQRRDRSRRERLEAAGWRVLEIREFTVWHRRDELLETVRAARRPRTRAVA
jgi:very-short-patch-repair endonuclease